MSASSINAFLLAGLLLTPTWVSAAAPGNAPANAPNRSVFCADIQISQRQLRPDGVEVTERYHERLYRTDRVIAFERVLPTAARPKPDHHGAQIAGEHKQPHQHNHHHPDGLVRRYEQLPNGQLIYSLFDDNGRREIQLQPGEFADFGFDGNFAALHALADPALLAKLGKQDQQLKQDDREVRWSGRDQIVRAMQQRWPGGDYQMTVTPATGCQDPRHSRSGYATIDYADTLD